MIVLTSNQPGMNRESVEELIDSFVARGSHTQADYDNYARYLVGVSEVPDEVIATIFYVNHEITITI